MASFFKGAKSSALHAFRNFTTTQQRLEGSPSRIVHSRFRPIQSCSRSRSVSSVSRRFGCNGVIGRNRCDPSSNGAKRFYSVDRYPVQHLEPRGPNRWFRNPRDVRIVVSVGHAVFLVGVVYFEFSEDVPYTKRRHFVPLSRDTERILGAKHFEEIKARYEGKILPPMHPESVRARWIAEDIIEALRRGLRNEQMPDVFPMTAGCSTTLFPGETLAYKSMRDTFEGTERVAHDTVMAPSGKKSEKLEETWSREEDLDDRRVDQSRKKGREGGSQPTTSHPDGFNWEVLVVHGPIVNARAFLDGRIVVFTGLLEHFGKDAEVATVIAHEMAHVVARHASEKVNKRDFVYVFRADTCYVCQARPCRYNVISSSMASIE